MKKITIFSSTVLLLSVVSWMWISWHWQTAPQHLGQNCIFCIWCFQFLLPSSLFDAVTPFDYLQILQPTPRDYDYAVSKPTYCIFLHPPKTPLGKGQRTSATHFQTCKQSEIIMLKTLLKVNRVQLAQVMGGSTSRHHWEGSEEWAGEMYNNCLRFIFPL